MKKNTLKNIAGLTLIEILIGVVISSIMMAAMYTTYTVVNNSYGQVVDKAKISRSGRDIVEMLMRDIRMAGFRYILGTNQFTIGAETVSYPTRTYLEFKSGHISRSETHDPIIIVKSELGYTRAELGVTVPPEPKHNPDDLCCDKIHIVYDDFNQNHPTQPYKRYKITYYALADPCTEFEEPAADAADPADPADPAADAVGVDVAPTCINGTYSIYKTFESWIQELDTDGVAAETGSWRADCNECYTEQKVRDHVVDMEFIPFDIEGIKINPLEATSENPFESNRQKIYDIRTVDVRLTFRSKKTFFKSAPRPGNPRKVKGISNRTREFIDKFFRDSVAVTVHTRNIGQGT
tara:strand:- start:2274 stop:3326 length:1053 start_codon:yes stop_codon:yes gene_type:complete